MNESTTEEKQTTGVVPPNSRRRRSTSKLFFRLASCWKYNLLGGCLIIQVSMFGEFCSSSCNTKKLSSLPAPRRRRRICIHLQLGFKKVTRGSLKQRLAVVRRRPFPQKRQKRDRMMTWTEEEINGTDDWAAGERGLVDPPPLCPLSSLIISY